jgi:hypothetical protein
MSSAEFVEWQAFQRLEGQLGPGREDWRVAMVASVIANGNRDPKRHSRAFEPKDFIPDWLKMAEAQDAQARPVADKIKQYFQGLVAKARATGRAQR